jgi:cell division septum initiation protein DivIVA
MGGAELVDTLNEMVSQLIKENRSLKRQLAKLSSGGATSANGAAERTLRSLQRKVQRAVASTPATRRRTSRTSTSTTRARSSSRSRRASSSE